MFFLSEENENLASHIVLSAFICTDTLAGFQSFQIYTYEFFLGVGWGGEAYFPCSIKHN